MTGSSTAPGSRPRLAEENAQRRHAGVLPVGIIAFGDDGTGAALCTEPSRPDITCWHPINAWKQPLAPDLAAFWQGWTDSTVTT